LGTDTDTHNGLKNDENTVVYNENGEGSVTITDQDGNTTTINNIVNTTYTAEQSVEAGEKGSTTFKITDNKGGNAGSMIINAGDNITITKDEDTGAAVINATDTDTTYSYTDTTENAKKDDASVVQQITVTENKPDGTTEVAKFTDTNTTYSYDVTDKDLKDGQISKLTITNDVTGDTTEFVDTDTDTTYDIKTEAGEKGSGVVNTYTMTGTNGDKYTFKDTDTDTTYKIKEKRDKKGTVAATYTVTDSNDNKVGEIQDTHNGLTGDTYEVKYDKNGKGSVTIKDQDGNEATITNIQSGGDAATINRLGDQISRMDSKIEKVGAGAAALAGLHPLDFDPDEKWDFSAAVGSYKSEQAVAIGAFYRPNEDTMFSIGGTIGNGNNMVNVGVSWKFGQKNRISANRISSAKEIIELRKNQEDVHSFLADAVAGNQLDLSKIQLFPDVEENHWTYDYVATMAGNGVLEGYPDGYFKGNRNMTRYEMAAVLYRLMQNGARLSDRALTEFAPELDRIRVDTITKHKDGTPHIQRVRTIKERVEEKADPSSKKETKKAKIKVAEKPME
ncbi:YadA-like family protein, partial [Succiniclasticum ruminis]